MYLRTDYGFTERRGPAMYGGDSGHYTVGVHRRGDEVEVKFRYQDAVGRGCRGGYLAMSMELAAWLADAIKHGLEMESLPTYIPNVAEREFPEPAPSNAPHRREE